MVVAAAFRALPLYAYSPFRRGAVHLPRGNVFRSACILVLKQALYANRRRLARRVTEITPLDFPEVSFEPVDSMVMDAVYWLGLQGYEGTVAGVWVRLCARAQSVLEIGGNIGLFTVIGARATSATYTVIEPVPEVSAILDANLIRNGLRDRVVLRQAAVIPGAAAREVMLNIPAEGRQAPVGAHLVESVEVSGRSTERRLAVPGIPMRELVAGKDLIKIDAEGIEAELLSSVSDVLLASRPDLLVEVLPEAVKLATVLARLGQEAGYRMYILPEYGSDQIVEVDPASFTAELPQKHNSKDIVLTTRPL